MIRTIALCLMALPAQAADLHFCWYGSNDYVMYGQMSVPDALMTGGTVTEDQITAFAIWGWRNDTPLGEWSMDQAGPGTRWSLTFDTASGSFAVGGTAFLGTGQEWNAGGTADDCGIPGFGFNAGNAYQDVCVDGVFHTDSSIDRFKPLIAVARNIPLACQPDVPLS